MAVELMISRVWCCKKKKLSSVYINSPSWHEKLIRLVGWFDAPSLHSWSCVKAGEYSHWHIYIYKRNCIHIFTLQALLMLKLTFSADGTIYFDEMQASQQTFKTFKSLYFGWGAFRTSKCLFGPLSDFIFIFGPLFAAFCKKMCTLFAE